jgi:hypothetical protein
MGPVNTPALLSSAGAHLGSTGIYDDVRLDPAATVDIILSPGADRLAYFKRRYSCHSRGLGADISASSARRKPDAFAITGADILAGDEYRCAGFGGKIVVPGERLADVYVPRR